MIQAKKFRALKSSSSKRTHDEDDATETRDGKKKKKALARGVKRSVEEDHVEDVHDDTLDIEHLHTINVVTSKFDSVDEQNELIGRISAKNCDVVITMEGQGNDTLNIVACTRCKKTKDSTMCTSDRTERAPVIQQRY